MEEKTKTRNTQPIPYEEMQKQADKIRTQIETKKEERLIENYEMYKFTIKEYNQLTNTAPTHPQYKQMLEGCYKDTMTTYHRLHDDGDYDKCIDLVMIIKDLTRQTK